jgi:excisionase family DNA binding protein
VPASALRVFLHPLGEMSQGNAGTLIRTHAERISQQAAERLNVLRPYLVKLPDEGKIPCWTVGKYRRVRPDDLLADKRKDDEARAKILDPLQAEAQELDRRLMNLDTKWLRGQPPCPPSVWPAQASTHDPTAHR